MLVLLFLKTHRITLNIILCKPQARKNGSVVLIFGALYKPCANHRHSRMTLLF